MRDPRYDVLFEPVRIGPVTAPNRFFQVPHASGMTNANPRMRAAFRGMKAEGGWGVVCTGAVSIHPSSDDAPLPCATLWDEADIRAHALATEAIHRHGALAGVELFHGGGAVMNRFNRTPPLSPSGIPWLSTHVGFMSQQRPRVMDRQDIRDLLAWQKAAARRALTAGFDILYVYAGMGYLLHAFLQSDLNHRTDAYGGGIGNRVRLVREMLEATREAAGGRAAVALRISLQELRARPGTHMETEAHEAIAALSEATDLFDVKMDYSSTDCIASRFGPEGSHEPTVGFVKSLTDKPVVGVGRFTSPDAMVSQIRRGVLDLIGAARPSIADPFLPAKIAEGRIDDIRECIGCNICISSWHDGVPVRCTQNPTAGEEWRRGWHPERIAGGEVGRVLVVGAGPAGLEAALTLGRRGFDVAVAEAGGEPGGRLLFESRLPGLSAWRRVVDYRMGQLGRMANVDLYFDSRLTADDVAEFGADHVVVATGAEWTRHLYAPSEYPIGVLAGPRVYTPTDLAAGAEVEGPVLVFDFDGYYMGGAVAELLADRGAAVTYATSGGMASAWTIMTNELPGVHRNLERRGIERVTLATLIAFDGERATLGDVFGDRRTTVSCRSVVIVGHREPRGGLLAELEARRDALAAAGLRTLVATGDLRAPGALAHVIHQAHLTARSIGAAAELFQRDAPFVPERPEELRAAAE